MKFKILGSGGCTSIPRPTCTCRVCVEAREKGKPYSRFGCSLLLEDINLLVDTPEDIGMALNTYNINHVDNVLFSHWHPDHTFGMRVFEQMKVDWCQISVGIKNQEPINIYGIDYVIDDIRAIKNKFGSCVEYYEKHNLIHIEAVEREMFIDGIKITFIPVTNRIGSIFLFSHEGKKVIYAPCNVKPFPHEEIFHNADLMIVGNTITSEVARNNFVVEKDNSMRSHMFVMEEIVDIKNKFNIKEVIITHIDEDWGLSYDDYIEKESSFKDIRFAYDGLEIDVI